MNNKIDGIMKSLAEYTRLQEETNAIIEGLKDELKSIMTAQNTDTLTGTEHKASWKTVTSSRFDSTAFKRDNPAVYSQYTKSTTSRRFTFS